ILSLLRCRRSPRSPLFPYTTLFRSVRVLNVFETTREKASHNQQHERAADLRGDERATQTMAANTEGASPLMKDFVHVATRSAKRSEEHTSELQSPYDLVCRLLLEKK